MVRLSDRLLDNRSMENVLDEKSKGAARDQRDERITWRAWNVPTFMSVVSRRSRLVDDKKGEERKERKKKKIPATRIAVAFQKGCLDRGKNAFGSVLFETGGN